MMVAWVDPAATWPGTAKLAVFMFPSALQPESNSTFLHCA
jgi:hypothetical protein